MVSAQDFGEYADLVTGYMDEASVAAERAVLLWFSEHPEAAVAEMREAAIEIMVRISAAEGERAAQDSATLFDRSMFGIGVGVTADGAYEVDEGEVERIVRYQAGKLKTGDRGAPLREEDVREFARQIGHGASSMVKQASRKPVINGVRRASKTKSGSSVRFARVPTGAETCTYCIMLASNGCYYKTEETAGHGDHR